MVTLNYFVLVFWEIKLKIYWKFYWSECYDLSIDNILKVSIELWLLF